MTWYEYLLKYSMNATVQNILASLIALAILILGIMTGGIGIYGIVIIALASLGFMQSLGIFWNAYVNRPKPYVDAEIIEQELVEAGLIKDGNFNIRPLLKETPNNAELLKYLGRYLLLGAGAQRQLYYIHDNGRVEKLEIGPNFLSQFDDNKEQHDWKQNNIPSCSSETYKRNLTLCLSGFGIIFCALGFCAVLPVLGFSVSAASIIAILAAVAAVAITGATKLFWPKVVAEVAEHHVIENQAAHGYPNYALLNSRKILPTVPTVKNPSSSDDEKEGEGEGEEPGAHL